MSVTARLLVMLPDHAVIVNTARGAVIDEDALTRELQSGRLRAGLDVLVHEGDKFPKDHPLPRLSNVIITAHQAEVVSWPLDLNALRPYHHNALDNLARFSSGQDLKFRIDEKRYQEMT